MSSIYVVSSAIGNDYGVFSFQERFDQLVKTIESIKKADELGHIILLDASNNRLPKEHFKKLENLVDKFFVFYTDPHVTYYSSKNLDSNRFTQKTFGEIITFRKAIEYIKTLNFDYDRVFKVCGRYWLNQFFDYQAHIQAKNSVVILKRIHWGDQEIFNIRLWSFDKSLLNNIETLFENIYNNTLSSITELKTIPIVEYSFFKEINNLKLPIMELEIVGIEGFFGQNAAPLKE